VELKIEAETQARFLKAAVCVAPKRSGSFWPVCWQCLCVY